MKDYYQILGLNSSATNAEVRRAYRILARRYHPDLNPGKNTEDKFKEISEAYQNLNDPEKRKVFDLQYESTLKDRLTRKFKSYGHKDYHHTKAQNAYNSQRTRRETQTKSAKYEYEPARESRDEFQEFIQSISRAKNNILRGAKGLFSQRHQAKNRKDRSVTKVSIIETSLDIKEAIQGTKKTIEIEDSPENIRKLSVAIPSGVYPGSVLRLRNKKDGNEELVLIIRVAQHPFLKMERRGIVFELPISIPEAIEGASIKVSTTGESILLKIPAGTQSGDEVRVRAKGVRYSNGERGDLYIRFLIKAPSVKETLDKTAICKGLEELYKISDPIRSGHEWSLNEL